MLTNQIPLPFSKYHPYDLKSFVSGKNVEVINVIANIIEHNEIHCLYLWGAKGTGKSHLLQAICTAAHKQGKTPAYLPLAEIENLSADMLTGLENLDLVCIDDIQTISGQSSWEEGLFHLFNSMKAENKCLVISADKSPQNLKLKLADLESRLSWDLVYRLEFLDEESLIKAMKLRANERMFDIPDEVFEYVLKRVPRDTHTLFNPINRLDEASIAEKKKITIPFVTKYISDTQIRL
jgi:DnaA family protein